MDTDAYRVTFLVSAEGSEDKLSPAEASDFADTFGAGPGDQWDAPPEVEVQSVEAPGTFLNIVRGQGFWTVLGVYGDGDREDYDDGPGQLQRWSEQVVAETATEAIEEARGNIEREVGYHIEVIVAGVVRGTQEVVA